MARDITVTFADGSTHVYQNAPDNVTPEQVSSRAQSEFGKSVKALDGGRNGTQTAKRPDMTALRPQDAATALQGAEADLNRRIAGASPQVAADARRRFDSNPDIQAMRAKAQAQPKTRTLGDYLGMGARAAVKGVTSLTGLTDMLTGQGIASTLTGVPSQGQLADASVSHLSDLVGLPKPETDNEKMGSAVVSGVAAAAPTLGMGGGWAVMPARQLISGGLAGAGQEYASQQGGGPVVQTLAALAAGAAPFAPSMVRSIPRAADPATLAGQRLGIRPTPATVGGPVARGAQIGLGNAPGSAGTIRAATAQEAGDLASSARNVADTLGPVSTPEGAGATLSRGAKAFERATKTQGGKLYTNRDALIGGKNAPVLMDSTRAEMTNFANQFPNTPVLASILEHPAVRKLAAALPDGAQPQLTVSEATDALSHIRASVRNAFNSNSITGPVKARIAKVEQAIENDVMRAAQSADAINGRLGNGAVEAQTKADKFWSARSRTLQGPLDRAVSSAREPAKVSSESVYRQMSADMGAECGNLTRLRQAWGALPGHARRTFSATAFDRLGRATPGAQNAEASAWSFDTFMTNYSKQSPEARNLIFGGRGVDQQIQDIATYASRLREIGQTRNFSNTARHTISGGLWTSIIGNLLYGNVPGAAVSAGVVPASWGASKVFVSTPAMRLWTRRALQVATSNNQQPQAIRALVARLPVIAAQNPGIREEVNQLAETLGHQIGVPVSAGDREKDQQDQQAPLQP